MHVYIWIKKNIIEKPLIILELLLFDKTKKQGVSLESVMILDDRQKDRGRTSL